MIKVIPLQDAPFDAPFDQRPSNSQLKRLTVGDRVLLSSKNYKFWVKLLFIRANDMAGIVEHDETDFMLRNVNESDLVSFERQHIHQVLPDETRLKLPPFMLLSHPESNRDFVMHTSHPRLIAIIAFGDQVEAREAVWLDEPVDYDKEGPALLKKMTDWYFYNYVNKKK